MTVARSLTFWLGSVAMLFFLSFSACTAVESQNIQDNRRIQQLEAEMQILRKIVTDLKRDCSTGLQGHNSPQMSSPWRLAQDVAELRAQVERFQLKKELSDLQEKISTLQVGLQTDRCGAGATSTANQTSGRTSSSQPIKAMFLGQLEESSSGSIPISRSSPINFTEIFDIGNGFAEGTGIYTAPYSGIYIINFQVFANQDKDFRTDLKVNDKTLVRSRPAMGLLNENGHRRYAPPSSGVATVASAGDKFWVEIAFDGLFWGGYHTYFSIVLVTSDA